MKVSELREALATVEEQKGNIELGVSNDGHVPDGVTVTIRQPSEHDFEPQKPMCLIWGGKLRETSQTVVASDFDHLLDED